MGLEPRIGTRQLYHHPPIQLTLILPVQVQLAIRSLTTAHEQIIGAMDIVRHLNAVVEVILRTLLRYQVLRVNFLEKVVINFLFVNLRLGFMKLV